MDTVFKTDQINILSSRLGVNKSDVRLVLDNYISRLVSKLENGETIKFLNICYLVNEEQGKNKYHETLAYISNEIGNSTKLGKELVFRILSEFSELIADDVKKFYSYTVWGLLNISCCEYTPGQYKVRIRKASK